MYIFIYTYRIKKQHKHLIMQTFDFLYVLALCVKYGFTWIDSVLSWSLCVSQHHNGLPEEPNENELENLWP